MRSGYLFYALYILCTLSLLENSAWGQNTEQSDTDQKPPNKKAAFRLSERDIILPVTSIEWGSPDRWSITLRYIRELDERKEKRIWHNNLSIAISPGISGGRIGFGYLCLLDPKSTSDFGIFTEARIVLLRTWGNPLSTSSNRTFYGGELRVALSFILNLGIGYYKQISDSRDPKDDFWGFHIGVGI